MCVWSHYNGWPTQMKDDGLIMMGDLPRWKMVSLWWVTYPKERWSHYDGWPTQMKMMVSLWWVTYPDKGGGLIMMGDLPISLTCLLTGRWCGCWHGMPTVHADITLTSGWCHPWHAYCACWHQNYVMLTSFISGSAMWVGSTGIRVGSAHPGEEDAWGASARVGRRLAGEWWRGRPCPMFDFDAVFTSGFVSASSTQWYGQNTILRTFIFEQKSNTT